MSSCYKFIFECNCAGIAIFYQSPISIILVALTTIWCMQQKDYTQIHKTVWMKTHTKSNAWERAVDRHQLLIGWINTASNRRLSNSISNRSVSNSTTTSAVYLLHYRKEIFLLKLDTWIERAMVLLQSAAILTLSGLTFHAINHDECIWQYHLCYSPHSINCWKKTISTLTWIAAITTRVQMKTPWYRHIPMTGNRMKKPWQRRQRRTTTTRACISLLLLVAKPAN